MRLPGCAHMMLRLAHQGCKLACSRPAVVNAQLEPIAQSSAVFHHDKRQQCNVQHSNCCKQPIGQNQVKTQQPAAQNCTAVCMVTMLIT